jgi:hypothetical protein
MLLTSGFFLPFLPSFPGRSIARQFVIIIGGLVGVNIEPESNTRVESMFTKQVLLMAENLEGT